MIRSFSHPGKLTATLCKLRLKHLLAPIIDFFRFQVVDSKQGPGPKHMKEITKRARRREAKQAAKINNTNTLRAGQGTSGGTTSQTAPSTPLRSVAALGSTPKGLSYSFVGQHNHHPSSHRSTTCVACWADQNPPARTRATARRLEQAECEFSILLFYLSVV